MENVGSFYGHFVYFTAKLYILWPFGALCAHLVRLYIFLFGKLYRYKSGNPDLETMSKIYKKDKIGFVGAWHISRGLHARKYNENRVLRRARPGMTRLGEFSQFD
jgi:hypothetical protein